MRVAGLEYSVQWQKEERPCFQKQGERRELTFKSCPLHVTVHVIAHMHGCSHTYTCIHAHHMQREKDNRC